ncbi:MAG TPA: MFS transporter [Thermomicrobiaceae bacterium]|nr:MFS transporter [Thermomicrobiaceae bacterium]
MAAARPQQQSPGTLAALVPALVVVFVAALDLTVIAPLLPKMLFDLQINTAEADRYVWIVSGYLIAYTVSIPLMGRLSDRIGRRATFLVALLVFLAGSGFSASAHSLEALIVARAVQGVGGGAMVPVAMALVGDLLPPEERAGALGVVAAVDTLGWVLGPIWGAVIDALFSSWRAVFWLNLPIGVLAVLGLVFFWRHRAAPRTRTVGGRPDVLGALLLSLGLVALNLGFASSAGGVSGETLALGSSPNPLEPYRIPLIVAGVVALPALVVVELRVSRPLIPMALFRDRLFSAANATNVLVGAGLMVALVNVPLLVSLLENADRATTVSAELLGAFSLTMAIGAWLGGRATRLIGYRPLIWVGLALAAIGFVSMSTWPNHIDLERMLPDLAVGGLGFGLVVAPIGAAAINAARQEDLGIASALVIVMRLLGMTLGISILTGWAVRRLNEALTSLPPVVQQPGESVAQYLTRQETFAQEHAIPLTLGIIRDTYGAAAVICFAALIPAAFLVMRHKQREGEPSEERQWFSRSR